MTGRRIVIVGEGQTEQSFCNDVLQSHFSGYGVSIQNPTIKKTGGGIVSWGALKQQVVRHLKEDKQAVVTTLIDYYGIHEHHAYPEWKVVQGLADKAEAVTEIETGMLAELPAGLRARWLPYIQLYELRHCCSAIFLCLITALKFQNFRTTIIW